jgi:hypothetical protein
MRQRRLCGNHLQRRRTEVAQAGARPQGDAHLKKTSLKDDVAFKPFEETKKIQLVEDNTSKMAIIGTGLDDK